MTGEGQSRRPHKFAARESLKDDRRTHFTDDGSCDQPLILAVQVGPLGSNAARIAAWTF